jgi:Transmembrane secretion effector
VSDSNSPAFFNRSKSNSRSRKAAATPAAGGTPNGRAGRAGPGGSGGRGSDGGRLRGRRGPLTEPNFRIFFTGYTTSLLGSAMAAVALTFAVLDSGHGPADLGYVLAADVVPQVLVMLGGGVLADRVGRRPVMLATDTARFAVQGTLAAFLFTGRPPIWAFILLAGLLGTGEGFFNPALGGLRAEVASPDTLPDANALLGVVQSGSGIIGPALAGSLIALSSPAVVIACDAASFAVSVGCLARLTVPPVSQAHQSPLRDFADGWAVFRSQTWLWVTTLQFTLFNLFSWAPYLLLGPILARQYLGGAKGWGIIAASYAAGSVLCGVALVGRRPARPLLVAAIGTLGYPVPPLLLALHAPIYLVAPGALAAGTGSAVAVTYLSTVTQQRVPRSMLGRVSALTLTCAYSLGSMSWIVIGSIAAVVGPGRMLGFAAAYAAVSAVVVICLPAIRAVRWLDPAPPGEPGRESAAG